MAKKLYGENEQQFRWDFLLLAKPLYTIYRE